MIIPENQYILKNKKNQKLNFNNNEVSDSCFGLIPAWQKINNNNQEKDVDQHKLLLKRNTQNMSFTKLTNNLQKKEKEFLFTKKKSLLFEKNNSFFSFFKTYSNQKIKYFFPYQKSFLCYWLLPFVGFVFTLNQQINSNLVNNQPIIDTKFFSIFYKNQSFYNNSNIHNNTTNSPWIYMNNTESGGISNISFANKNLLFYLIPKIEKKPSIQQNIINLNMDKNIFLKKFDNFFTNEYDSVVNYPWFKNEMDIISSGINFNNHITNYAIFYLKSLENFIEFSSFLPTDWHIKPTNFQKTIPNEIKKNNTFFSRKKIFKSFWLNLDITPISNQTPFFFVNELHKPYPGRHKGVFAYNPQESLLFKQNILHRDFSINLENAMEKKNRHLQALFIEEKKNTEFLNLNMNYSNFIFNTELKIKNDKSKNISKFANKVGYTNKMSLTNLKKQFEYNKLPLLSFLKLELLFDNFIKKELLECKPYLFKNGFNKAVSKNNLNRKDYLKNNNPVSLLYLVNKINNKNRINIIGNHNNVRFINEAPNIIPIYSINNFIEKNLSLLKEWPNFFYNKLGQTIYLQSKDQNKVCVIKNNLNYKKLSKEQLYKLLFNSFDSYLVDNSDHYVKVKPTSSDVFSFSKNKKQEHNNFYIQSNTLNTKKNTNFVNNEIILPKQILISSTPSILLTDSLLLKQQQKFFISKTFKSYGKKTEINKINNARFVQQKADSSNDVNLKNKKNSIIGVLNRNLQINPLNLSKNKKIESYSSNILKIKEKNLKSQQKIKNEYINYSLFIKKINLKLKNLFIKKQLKHSSIVLLRKSKNLKLQNFKEFFIKKYKTSQIDNTGFFNLNNSQEKMEKLLRTYFSIKNKGNITLKETKLTHRNLYNFENNKRKKAFYNQIKQEIFNKYICLKTPFDLNLFNQQNKEQKLAFKSWSQSEENLNKIEDKIYSPRFLIKNRSFILTSTSKPNRIPSSLTDFSQWSELMLENWNPEYNWQKDNLTNSTSIIDSEIKKTLNEINLEKQRKYIQKKRRRKKLKKETRRRKKRKRFYPRPNWLRYRSFLKFLNKRKKELTLLTKLKKGSALSLANKKKTNTDLFFNDQQKQNKREKLLRKYYAFSYNYYPLYMTNKDQQHWLKNANLSENKETLYKEIQQKSENLFSMHITNKDNFIICRSILVDFKKLLWKSYWLRSNLNPYLKRVKNFLTKIKESKQKWEFFQNLNIFLNYMAGFNIKTRFINNNNYNQFIKDKSTNQIKHQFNQWENTLYFAEYNRITYYRMQEFISQIRENFATLLTNKNTSNNNNMSQIIKKADNINKDNLLNKSLKVRSSHLSHSKMQDNKRQNIISRRKTTDFWVKLGKAVMADSQSSTIAGGVASQAQINEKTYFKKRKEWWLLPNYIFNNSKIEPTNPQIKIIWALSKITPSLNSHLSISDGLINRDPNTKSKTNINSFLYKRRKTWSASPESSKFREQTKYNKTKKMYRDLSIKLQTLLNEQNEFLFKFSNVSFEKNKNNLPNETNFIQNKNNMSYNKTLSIFEKRFLNHNSMESLNTNYNNETTPKGIGNVSETNKDKVNDANANFNNQLLNKLFKKVRQKEDKSNFLNKNQRSSLFMTKKGIRLYKKMLQINPNYIKKNKLKESNHISEFFVKEPTWFNNLTNKTSFVFWWTIYTNKFKNIFNFLSQKEDVSYAIPFSSRTENVLSKINVIKERQTSFSVFYIQKAQNEHFLKTAWVCSLLFHFCSILSLISFSQIRDLLKFYLLGISKIYKISLGLLEYIYNSFSRFKLLIETNFVNNETIKNNKIRQNENKAYLVLDKILINYLNKPASINQVKNFINKNKIFAVALSNSSNFTPLTTLPDGLNFNESYKDKVNNPVLKNYERKNQSFLALKFLTNIVINTDSVIFTNETNKSGFKNKDKATTSLFVIKKLLLCFAIKIINLASYQNVILATQNKNNYNLLPIKSNVPLYFKNYTILYSLFFLNFIIKNFYAFTIGTNSFLKQSFDLIGRFGPKSIFNFLEKPGELIIDWIAYMFLVEWSSDLTNTIPENVDIYLGTSYYKFIRTFHSLNFLTVLQSLHIYQKLMINNPIPLIAFNFKNTNNIIKDNFYWQKLGTEQLGISNLNLSILNLGSTFIQNRIYHLYEILLFQFYQPDSDLIIRQKKGIIFWDIWGDFLMQVAEDSNINISELTSLKEEQIKLLEKSLLVEIKQPEKNNNFNILKNKKIKTAYTEATTKNFIINHNFFNLLKKQPKKSSFLKKELGSKENKKIQLSFIAKNFKNYLQNTKTNIINPGHKETSNFVAQQFLSYQGKDTELFIDLHPPKSFTMISLLKKNESVQTSIGSLVCQIFSGIMSKQISKNILVVSSEAINTNQKLNGFNEVTPTSRTNLAQNQKNRKSIFYKKNFFTSTYFLKGETKANFNIFAAQEQTGFINNQIYSNFYQNSSFSRDNQQEKTLLIQAIAGETELKIITDNAYRYAMVYRGVAVGIKLLRDVFDSLSLHTPCLFLIEDIHAIGERRPLLISDDEKGSSPNGKPVFGSQREEIHEKNQVLYQLSKHVISHYRKPYKGDFSLLIPTNHFCFDLFKPNLDSFSVNKINPSSLSFPSPKIFVQSKASNDSNQILNDSLSSNLNSSKSTTEKNFYKSRLLIKSSQLFSPPATSPFSVLNLKEQKKFQPYKIVSEMPWGTGLRQSSEQIAQLSKASYSIRVKVAVLADMAISTLSVKLDMITDLLVIIDSVKGNRGFVVFATTHIPYILDPALRRPGRLDETITLGLFPHLLSRWNILKSSFGLFKAGKQQTGFKNGLSLDLTFSIQNSSLPYLLSSVFYSSKFYSIFAPQCSNLTIKSLAPTQSDQFFTTNPFSYSLFTKNKNISKNFFTLNSFASNKYKKGTEVANILLNQNQNKIVSFAYPYLKNYHDTIHNNNNNKNKKMYRYNKKRIKILSQTYFIASNLLYESKINIVSITNNNNNYYNLNKIESNRIINTKLKDNFLDFLQPLNMDTSLLYISLYTSPQQFQNSIIKLMSGKLGEIFLFSNFRKNNLYTLNNKNVIKNLQINSFKNISDFTSFGLSNSWKILSSLILSFVQKRYIYNNNLIITKFLDFNNKNSSCPKGEVPSPPSSNIFLPARRYENYRRSFAFFADRNTSIGIMEKIQTHQQQRLIKRLYGFPVKETFKSEVLENRFTSFTNANLMIGSFSSLLQKPSHSNWFFKNRILMRHKNYLTNQWWNAQLPEHNAETTFLSDIDWRYTFVELIGDLLLDFPDADQHYNPKNRRWLLTKGDYHNWFNFEKNFYNEIYTHFIFNSFIKAYNLFENNREVLDFYAFYILQKGLYNNHTLNEFEIIKLYKRFI